jgi:hypothetical protein
MTKTPPGSSAAKIARSIAPRSSADERHEDARPVAAAREPVGDPIAGTDVEQLDHLGGAPS